MKKIRFTGIGLLCTVAVCVGSATVGGFSLAQGQTPDPKPSAEKGKLLFEKSCMGCHGENGNSTQPNRPRLAGQLPGYLTGQLTILKQGIRPSPVMNPIAGNLSTDDINNLVAFLSSQKAKATFKPTDSALVAKGKTLFLEGRPTEGVLACAICHGSNGEGFASGGAPRIANQSPGYVLRILGVFKAAPKFEVAHPAAMKVAVSPLSNDDLKAVTEYLSSLE